MLKVLSIVDKEGSAIWRMATGMAKYHDNINYKVLAVHPKRPDLKQLENFEREYFDADILDFQYFRTAEFLKSKYDLKNKKQILAHHNPYSITEDNWNDYDLIIANNQYIYDQLGKITEKPLELIPNTVDTDFWIFNHDWKFEGKVNSTNKYEFQGGDDKPSVLMVAARIESKKGILPVAIACADLNIHFKLVGLISDRNYFESIMATTGNVEFYENISDEKLRELYYNSTIHVCNSIDNFESGTNPILEAMLTGVPVLTREVGHVPDLYNGSNMMLLTGQPEDVQGISDKLLDMLSDRKKLMEMRESAWKTAKTRSHERRAYQYQKLYRQVYSDQISVSVIVPIYDKPEIISKCLNAISEQTHKNTEIIVVDDNYNNNYDIIQKFEPYTNFPLRYINTSYTIDYGLARARNEGTIEATGDVIVYCDQRMIMASNAIEEFLKYLKPRTWLYGNKGGKKDFVENFSCVYRDDIINAGLFNERIYLYGGMSQEIRARIRNQGIKTEFVESAKAIPAGKSRNKYTKKADIIKMKNRLYKMGLE